MGKRRDSRNFCADCDGDAATGKFYGGGGGKYGVFDFDDADRQAEAESRRSLAKFRTTSPSRKASHHRQPLDKYFFLEHFTCGEKSPSKGRRNSKSGTTTQNDNTVLYVHSDEDECMELRSPTTSKLGAGSLEEQSSDCGKYLKNNDCVAMVVLDPIYVKYGNKYYTGCRLTFSKRWIQLKGSSLCDRNVSYCVEWTNLDILAVECESVGANGVSILIKAFETGNRNSGCVELEFAVLNDPQWSKKQEEIKSLDLRYKSAWKTIECVFNFNESFEEITYPEGDPDAVFIGRGDIELLQPKTFINDTLIDFYIKYLAAKIRPEEQHRFYFFNTFFFRKLVDMDRDACRTWDVTGTFQRVRKWTRNVKLFEKDYIFMPINLSLHWSLIVICHPGEVPNIEGSTNDSSKVPCILHMNSIEGSHRGFESLIRRYLWEEWKEQQNIHEKYMARSLCEESKKRVNIHEDYIEWKFQNLDFVVPKLPQQENLFDCGLFLLHYAELFLEQVSSTGAPAYFAFLNEDWFHPAEVSLKKRDQIRKLIYRIAEKKAVKSPSAACDENCRHTTVVNGGDTSAQLVQESSANQSCLGIKFLSFDGCRDFTGQQSDIIFTTDERCQPCNQKQPIPVSEFSNMWLPMEEGSLRQKTCPPQDVANKHESYEDDKSVPPSLSPSSINSRELKLSEQSSKAYCSKTPITYYVEDEVRKVTTPAEEEKERYEISSMSSVEDLTDCIVEDSEEEIVMESRQSRRFSLPHSPINLNMYGSP